MKKFRLLILGVVLCLPFFFIGCSNKKSVSLKTPSIIDVEDGKIIFSKVEHADYYTVLLNDVTIIVDHKFDKNVKIVDDTIQFDLNSVLIDGTNYSIKVRANTNKNKFGKYSDSFDYQHGEDVETPFNAKIVNSTLTWDNVPTASYYLVKAITPSDTAIFDKSGNQINIENNEDILNAQLREFICNKNSFAISDFVNTPGEYTFYVASVFAQGGKVTISNFATKQTYTHSRVLTTPTNLSLSTIDNTLFLSCILDNQANAISIKAGAIEKTVELNNSNSSITQISDNYLNINLNSYFDTYITNNDLVLNQVDKFEVQSKFITNGANPSFTDSEYSNIQQTQPKQDFVAPELTLEFNNQLNKFVANWVNHNIEKSNYTLILFKDNGITEEIVLNSSTNSFVVEQDFISLAIMINANNNHNQSPLSNFVSKSNITSSNTIEECSKSNDSLIWNSINNAYYVIEINNSYYICTSNSIYYNSDAVSETVKITAIIDGFEHRCESFNIANSKKLQTPVVSNITTNNKKCQILINTVEGAIGYQVYMKNNLNKFVKINHIFTGTLIDLTEYLTLNNIDYNFELKIQAIGAHSSIYQNSELSDSVIVSASKKHITPSFVTINNIETPIFKVVDGNTEKYVLKFMGVKNTAKYIVSINNHTFEINADTQNEQKIYEKDVSDIITNVGKYSIQLTAIPAVDTLSNSNTNIKEFVLKHQLSNVDTIEIASSNDQKILTFNMIENAEKYQVRIVKDGDTNYESKLQQKGLSSSFTTTGAVVMDDYLTGSGNYHIYVSALAGSNNQYYYDSVESKIIYNVE